MVEDGLVCRLRDRLTCEKCRVAREAEVTARVAKQVATAVRAPGMEMFAPGKTAAVPGPTEAIMVDTFLNYTAPDKKEWRVERGSDLLTDYDIAPGQIKRFMGMWHACMAGQEKAWLFVRRLYGIAPMLGTPELDDLRVWTVDELGAKLGLDTDQIHAVIGETKLHWARYRAVNATERKSMTGADAGGKKIMTDAEVADTLALYDFTQIIGEAQRRYVAKRCLDFQAYLESDTVGMIARSAIQEELNIFFVLDMRIAQHQALVAQKLADQQARGVTGSVNEDSENERLTKLMRARSDANESYQKTLKTLGATEIQTGSLGKKRNFLFSLGGIIQGVQEYYANADNALIDGYCTEAEVVIAMAETDIRPVQYRPDIVVGWTEAMDNLWNPQFEPTPVGRERSRRIRGILKSAWIQAMGTSDDAAPVEDDAMLSAAVDDLPGSVAPNSPAPAGLMATSAASMNGEGPVMPRRPRNDDNDVAVF